MPEKIVISAIVCEFDPLHLGHRLLLNRARASGGAVCCVMSGHFLQRGGAAMADKWARARCALLSGADLVVELPLPFSCAGAERFAAGGVALAGALGAGKLFFGSEVPEAGRLLRIAQTLLSDDFPAALASVPDGGLPFAVRRQKAAAALLGREDAAALSQPNAILGIEYIKAILSQGLSIQPVPVERAGAGHGEALPAKPGALLSASQLRGMASRGEGLAGLVPAETLAVLERERWAGRFPAELWRLERAVLAHLRGMEPEDFAALPDLSEGLENRLYKASRQAGSLEELYGLAKSKRYSHARVRRLVAAAFLGIRRPLPALPPYIRPLAMNERGAGVLKGAALPVAVRAAELREMGGEAWEVFRAEARAGDIWGLACPKAQEAGRDFRERLVKAES